MDDLHVGLSLTNIKQGSKYLVGVLMQNCTLNYQLEKALELSWGENPEAKLAAAKILNQIFKIFR